MLWSPSGGLGRTYWTAVWLNLVMFCWKMELRSIVKTGFVVIFFAYVALCYAFGFELLVGGHIFSQVVVNLSCCSCFILEVGDPLLLKLRSRKCYYLDVWDAPPSSSLAGPDVLNAGESCSRLSPSEVVDRVFVGSTKGSLGMPRRRGCPKKARGGATACAMVVDPGKGSLGVVSL